MLDKIIIIDFEDSFTFNIAEVLYPFEKSCKVVNHVDFFSNYIDLYDELSKNHAIILGPGPGHPGEYSKYEMAIEFLMNHPRIYLMGICLGHQIIGLIEGYEIKEVPEQMHGESIEIQFQNKNLLVQRYNSLGVFSGDKEWPILQFDHGISYQFHPESVGTSNPTVFFSDLLDFLKI